MYFIFKTAQFLVFLKESIILIHSVKLKIASILRSKFKMIFIFLKKKI